jgi:hypothetical protein
MNKTYGTAKKKKVWSGTGEHPNSGTKEQETMWEERTDYTVSTKAHKI